MQTTASDRDDRPADSTHANPPADDTELRDIFDLWRDLGGSD
jgi:hypothetical protein